jgi:nitroreductase
MELYDVINNRRSIRKYLSEPVEQEKLDRIWQAIQVAPTACNYQPFRFLLVQSDDLRNRIEEVLRMGSDGKGKMSMHWVMKAPHVVIGLGNKQTAWKRFDGTPSHVIDVAIAMEHLVLAAANEGLGTCWVCAYNQESLHEVLGLTPEWEAVALTPLGYPNHVPKDIPRKAIGDLMEVV